MSDLVKDVAQRLKIPDEEAKLVLNALSKLIRRQAMRDGVVRVPEIGVFRYEDKKLTFTPDEQLKTAANHRYGGMKPLPALAALEGGYDMAALDMPEDFVLSLDRLPESVDSEEVSTQQEEKDASVAARAETAEGQDELAEPVSEVLESDTADSAGASSAPSQPVEKDRAAAPPPREKTSRPTQSSWFIIALLVVGLVIGGGVWLLTGDGTGNNAAVSNGAPITEQPAPADVEDPPPAPAEEDEDAPSDEPVEEDAPLEEPQVEIDVAAGGYTLVVTSRSTRAAIENVVGAYREVLVPQGYPVSVLAPREGETRYRLGVGQFDDVDAAVGALEELSGQIPSGSWVLRLRPEMDPDS